VIDAIRQYLSATFGAKILREYTHCGQTSWYVEPQSVREIAVALKNHGEFKFDYLLDICAVDHLGKARAANGRFEVIYTLLSVTNNARIMLRISLNGDSPKAPSLVNDWHGANWLEREVWDLMGIEFVGHPELTDCFIKPPGLAGFPHRKDFALTYEIPQFSHNKDLPVEVVRDNPNH